VSLLMMYVYFSLSYPVSLSLRLFLCLMVYEFGARWSLCVYGSMQMPMQAGWLAALTVFASFLSFLVYECGACVNLFPYVGAAIDVRHAKSLLCVLP
jgi:hypothetical protein